MTIRPERRRLRAAVLALAVAAAGLTTVSVTGSGAVAETTPPAAVVSASTVSFFRLGQTAGTTSCVGATESGTADPAFARKDCGFVTFTASGVASVSTLSAALVPEGSSTPFATPAVTAGTTAGTYRVALTPDASWPSGAVRLLLRDAGAQVADVALRHNALAATLTAPTSVKAGEAVPVSGTVVEHDAAGADKGDKAVPAAFTVVASDPTGTQLWSTKVTAGSTGTFTATVPAGTTSGLVPADGASTVGLALSVVDATYTDSSTGAWSAERAGTTGTSVAVPATGLRLHNSFVSSVGWVKPHEEYPSRVTLENATSAPVADATVTIPAPQGARFTEVDTRIGQATVTSTGGISWTVPSVPVGTSSLTLLARSSTLSDDPQLVWRDLSSTATLVVGGTTRSTSTSHGPKVIPPDPVYDTARYGDRPFPIVPVEYRDRAYQSTHSGDGLESVINDPANQGSTFNLFQEMSLGQLFPDGTVPSAGLATADFASYEPGFPFTGIDPSKSSTCAGGVTRTSVGGQSVNAPGTVGGTGYTERITRGVYNLPGNTAYYGSDANGSAVVGSVSGVGALQNIDAGCGPTGKLVADAAALADPEIDYSDYDTDKDGVVDFFMVVNAGCGGNGASQQGAAGCSYSSDAVPYDNIWPHSSSLEGSYTDPATGLPGWVTDDQLKDLEGRPLWWTDKTYSTKTTTDTGDALKVFVRVGPYNVNPETAIDHASVISHEYGHSLGLPDFYSTGNRETYGDWNLMATDKSQDMDAYSRQELGWVVPEVLAPGTTLSEKDIPDSKQDTGVIHWRTQDGTPYTLTSSARGGSDGIVHNSRMYVAKLPGRTLLDPAVFDSGATASKSHLWWSGSGNDFGCSPSGGHNLDLALGAASSLPAGTPISLTFKSNFNVEWDFDYGFVLTSGDGKTYTSHASTATPSSTTTSRTQNPNQSGCLDKLDNGITGNSASYAAGTQAADRTGVNPTAPTSSTFIKDSFDVSDLAGKPNPVVRFSYNTDPGFAGPGWFIDDVTVTATVAGKPQVLYSSDFEKDGTKDPAVYNGGCQDDLSVSNGVCTVGWNYLDAGAASAQDHAYYLEMRDRSGFDADSHGQSDRGVVGWDAGLYLSYTDEAHGYGNVGTGNPPAQSPLDSVPTAGNDTPELDDAAFTAAAARSTFSDTPVKNDKGVITTAGHVDNYTDASSGSGNWEFNYGCLGFTVDRLVGAGVGPTTSDGDLTGDVTFRMGTGCGPFNYGYGGYVEPKANTAPVAAVTATPSTVAAGTPVSLSGAGSTDAETPADGLGYTWDFGDGGSTKDATGGTTSATYTTPGTYLVTLTVNDPQGLKSVATTTVTVTGATQPTDSPTGNPSATATTTATATATATATVTVRPSTGAARTQTRIRLPRPVQVRGSRPVRLLFQVVGNPLSAGSAGDALVRIDGKLLRSVPIAVTGRTGKTVSGLDVAVPRRLSPGTHRVQVVFAPANPAAYAMSTSRAITLTVRPRTRG